MYYFENENSELCYNRKFFERKMKVANLEEVTVIEAIREKVILKNRNLKI
jgi:hypothetical protein